MRIFSVTIAALLYAVSSLTMAEYSATFHSQFGKPPSNAGGHLYYPSGVAVDPANGDVYVISYNHNIQRYSADGIFLNMWGLTGPLGIAVDPVDHYVYVTSTGFHKVFKYDQFGNEITSWGGKGDAPGQFNKPSMVAVHPFTRNVWVLDSINRRVQEFTPDGDFIKEWGDNNLYNPYGIAIDPTGEFIWVANTGTVDVRKYDLDGNLLQIVGQLGGGPGDLRWPRGVALDANSNIYVAATDLELVNKYDPEGNFLKIIKGPETDEDGPAHPRAIAINRATGHIYTAAAYANRVDHFDENGDFIAHWGVHDRDGEFLSTPRGMTLDPVNEVIWVADTYNHLIKKFSLAGEFISQHGNWPFVHRDETSVHWPAPMTVDADGDLWVINQGILYPDDPGWGSDKYIREFDTDFNYKRGISDPDFYPPTMNGIAINDAAQEVYVSNARYHKLMRFRLDGTFLGEWGSKGNGSGQFNTPAGILLNLDQSFLLVVDAFNHRIKKYDLGGNYIESFGSLGSDVGQFNFNEYSNMAYDDHGNLYVADTGNWRIQVFDSNLQYRASIGGNGFGPGQFRAPVSVAFHDGRLYVLDSSSRNVEIFTITQDNPPVQTGVDTIWIDDSVPMGSNHIGTGTFVSTNPSPYSGTSALQTPIVSGLHQDIFDGFADPLVINAGDYLVAYVYLDPENMPREIMLQWYAGPGGGGWQHRAYWGENLIAWGVDGTFSRVYMGPLPAEGGWVRLEVPASAVDMENRTVYGMSLAIYDGRATWDAIGKMSVLGNPPPAPEPLGPLDYVWIDDEAPAGATYYGSGSFVDSSPMPFSGGAALRSPIAAGMYQDVFDRAAVPMAVGEGDSLIAYVYLDPANMPREIMLQWYAGPGGGGWQHRAYWGENLIEWGVNGTASRAYMGSLPAAGGWVRLEVPASVVDMENRVVSGMSLAIYDGRATWDAIGKKTVLGDSPSPPEPLGALDFVWIDDEAPAGATYYGSGSFVISSPTPFSGVSALQSQVATGMYQDVFDHAEVPLSIGTGDSLFAYVYLDPANIPREIMLQWYATPAGGGWQHRAYWGENLIEWGVSGTASRAYMGPLPAAGGWVRLEVPASVVDMENRVVSGMSLAIYDGRATWDAIGRMSGE